MTARFLLAVPLVLWPLLGMAGPLAVKDAAVPAMPPTAMAHAAYMTLQNTSDREVVLIGASAQDYAGTHLHLSEDKNGVATMTPVDAITLAPGQSVTLAPGGLHLMLMRPSSTLQTGAVVPMTLQFADGTTQDIAATVVTRDAIKPAAHNHGS